MVCCVGVFGLFSVLIAVISLAPSFVYCCLFLKCLHVRFFLFFSFRTLLPTTADCFTQACCVPCIDITLE